MRKSNFTITTMQRTTLFILALLLSLGRLSAQTGHFIPSEFFSSGLINSLCQDKYGSIWIATDYGLNRYDGYKFQTFLHDDDDEWSICDNGAVTMLCDRKGRVWVGTVHGLDRYDEAAEGFVHYKFPSSLQPRVSSLLQLSNGKIFVGTSGYGSFIVDDNDVVQQADGFADAGNDHYFSRVLEDSRGRFWKSASGNTVVMKSGSRFHHFEAKGEPQGFVERDGEVFIVGTRGITSFRNGQIVDTGFDLSVLAGKEILFNSVDKDKNGIIYIGTRGHGLFYLPVGSRRLERYETTLYGADLNTTKVRGILTDRSGNLWIGLQRKGLVLVPQRPMQFRNWSFEAQDVNVSAPISSVCEGDGGITWCTVQGVGVYGFNQKGSIVAHPSAPDAVEFIFRDKRGSYWVGTDDALYTYNPLTGSSQQKVAFDCDRFNDMTSDEQGNIYISTFSRGFCVYNPETGSLKNYRNNNDDTVKVGHLCNDWIMCMTPDRDGVIWMGTASGVSCFDPRTGSFLSHGWNQLLDGIICFSVCELQDGNIAIGTDRGLYLYDHKKRQTILFPGSEQLKNKTVNYIVQSNDGDVWCSTSMGIWQYDDSKRQFIGHIGGNGLITKEYLYGVGMHADNDVIYFGTNDGLTVFSPKDIKAEHVKPAPLQLSAFYVGNQAVNTRTVLNGVQITDQAVVESNYFTLSYLDHTVTLGFSQFNFDNPMNSVYEYSINNGEWISNMPGNNEITLNHLQPGTYRIAVRAAVGQGDYTPVKVIVITVRAPWYRSLLAYFIYFAILASLATYIFLTYRRRANEQLNEEKMKFLINATHDIRSPLTLIMSPLANLRRRLNDDQKDARRDVDTIEHNAKRILNLVNQILDVRKIDKQQMQLHCEQTDLVPFVASLSKMFEYNAQERNIDFRFLHDGLDSLDVWVDRGQFDKVVTNLLSNAFKYSQDGGAITISLTEDGDYATVRVTDNGVGLDNDSLRHIFERFYQGGNSRRMHIDGTGIGLNLCKMIVDMHHGTITAENRSDGQQGSVFTVKLPLGNAHLKPEEIESTSQQPAHASQQPAANSSARYRVLIVDDDREIGNYISSELGHYYKFSICSNGREGLKELLTNPYDLVISDVMMPEMDGFTMLRMIKTNLNISHLPVIMLTSKADVGNRLEGLERGADAFLAKPFNMEELHMNIENLIHSRLHLKGKFSGAQQQAELLEQPEVKGNDELLMERIMKVVNKNLSNSDFNVDMLTQEVGISRAQLHRKMKELTGISTSEFIRNIRLEQAARLLKEQKVNITQVAYAVGFSNLAHFSTVFRKHFGVSPSEYAEREGEGVAK